MTHMTRAYSHDAHDAPNAHHRTAGADSHRPVRRRAAAAPVARPQPMLVRERDAMTTGAQPQSLDLKALRLAVHGWWLGNPLVYRPGAADLRAVARELAHAGAASGSLVLSDVPAGSDRHASVGAGTILDAETILHDAVHAGHAGHAGHTGHTVHTVHAVLILRLPRPRTPVGLAAAHAVAEVAQAALGRPCTVHKRWQVVLCHGDRVASRLCRVSVEQDEEVALVDMRLALGRLWQAARNDTCQLSSAIFARSDWREVVLAQVLHVLDGRLRPLHAA